MFFSSRLFATTNTPPLFNVINNHDDDHDNYDGHHDNDDDHHHDIGDHDHANDHRHDPDCDAIGEMGDKTDHYDDDDDHLCS